jgi:hypothetical protein
MSKEYTIFMLVKTMPAWLALNPAERFAFLGETITPILRRHPAVRMRFFDVEAYSARSSDVVMWQTETLAQYESVVENLRETRFWDDYFAVLDILPGRENAYADHYQVAPIQA